jgi:osmoprotectant transport system substrate-binding protein
MEMRRMRRTRTLRLTGSLLAATLLVTACGDDTDDTDDAGTADDTAGDDGEGSLAQDYDLDGLELRVGTKDFAEQYVLGQIVAQALEAAGATVEYTQDLASPDGPRNALLAGEIDVAWEYTGTAYINYLGYDEPIDDPREQFEAVRDEDLEENGVVWSEPAPFDNTYGFAMSQEAYDEHGLDTVSDLASWVEDNPGDATLCADATFPTREDGLPRIEEVYGFDWPTDAIIGNMDFGVIYTSIAERDPCEIGEIFTTDGRIPFLDLTIVDDQDTFIIYNVSINVRDEVYQENTDAFDTIAERILEDLDNDTMAELNRQVSVDGEEASDVARSYLQEQGLI